MYLDILDDGKRHKEYLKLYLIPARTAAEREQNKQTLSVANAMRSRRQLEIINGEYDIAMPKKAEVYFLDYYRKLCERAEYQRRPWRDSACNSADGVIAAFLS